MLRGQPQIWGHQELCKDAVSFLKHQEIKVFLQSLGESLETEWFLGRWVYKLACWIRVSQSVTFKATVKIKTICSKGRGEVITQGHNILHPLHLALYKKPSCPNNEGKGIDLLKHGFASRQHVFLTSVLLSKWSQFILQWPCVHTSAPIKLFRYNIIKNVSPKSKIPVGPQLIKAAYCNL